MERNFNDYPIHPHVKIICQALGYTAPSHIQRMVIENYLENDSSHNLTRNIIITSQAGSGKTFSYLICLLTHLMPTVPKLQAIILLPTRELALQTVDYFNRINKANLEYEGAKIFFKYKILIGGNAGIPGKKQKNEIFREDGVQIIIGTLGKTSSVLIKNQKLCPKDYYDNLRMIVIDEADKLLSQNRNKIFEKLFSQLSQKLKFQNSKGELSELILCSASFNKTALNFYFSFFEKFLLIQQDEVKFLNKSSFIVTSEESKDSISSLLPFNKIENNITEFYYVFQPQKKITYYEQKYEVLFEILNKMKEYFKQCLIFYNQKGKGEEIATDLRNLGWNTTFIHGDLSQDQRLLLYEKIKNIDVKVILSTDLFSRGIDLTTVDLVINFDSPFKSEEYFHRVGRTGRYNSHGVSISFFQENEETILAEIKHKDDSHKMKEISHFDESFYSSLISFFSIYILYYSFILETIEQENKFSLAVQEKIEELKNKNQIIASEEEMRLLNKKRRNEQYKQESLPSEWVDIDQKLYDEETFQYATTDPPQEGKCQFCLYCNLMKLFDV